ncbi:hypothetical protein GCM10027273_09040 [Nocardioides pakistanensis]
MIPERRRQPRGTSAGGQFAREPHSESVCVLTAAPTAVPGLPDWTPPVGTDDPAGAFSRCKEVSAEYTEHLRMHGIDADWVQVVGPRGDFPDAQTQWRTVDQAFWQHYLTRVTASDGTPCYIDWTARQFDPAAAYPQITPVDDRYLAAWRRENRTEPRK